MQNHLCGSILTEDTRQILNWQTGLWDSMANVISVPIGIPLGHFLLKYNLIC